MILCSSFNLTFHSFKNKGNFAVYDKDCGNFELHASMPGINYANVWTINRSKSLPGFRLATLTDGVKRPVYSDIAERRKRFEVISEIQATLIRLFMLC